MTKKRDRNGAEYMFASDAARYCGVSRNKFDRDIRPLLRWFQLGPGSNPQCRVSDIDSLYLNNEITKAA